MNLVSMKCVCGSHLDAWSTNFNELRGESYLHNKTGSVASFVSLGLPELLLGA